MSRAEQNEYAMNDTPIPLPTHCDAAQVERSIDAALDETGLRVTLKNTLRQFPGCVHWHVKRDREAGTLEVTFWPAAGRAWFNVHRNREAAWIAPAITAVQQALERLLHREH